jgi:hypothetical protein
VRLDAVDSGVGIAVSNPSTKIRLPVAVREYVPTQRGARDLPLNFHPVAIRASAVDTPFGAVWATGQRAEPLDSAA